MPDIIAWVLCVSHLSVIFVNCCQTVQDRHILQMNTNRIWNLTSYEIIAWGGHPSNRRVFVQHSGAMIYLWFWPLKWMTKNVTCPHITYLLAGEMNYAQNDIFNRALIGMKISRYRSAPTGSNEIIAYFIKSRYHSTQFRQTNHVSRLSYYVMRTPPPGS